MQHAYAATNKCTALAAAAFTWSTAVTTNRSYLFDGRMDKAFAVGSVSSTANVIIDFGTATALTCIALLNTNIASATAPTITITAADDAGFSVNLVTPKAATTPNTTAPRSKDHVLQFASVSKRYWKVTWAWTGSFALTVGEIYAAVTTALTRTSIYGWGEREEYVTTRAPGYSGENRGAYISGPFRVRRMTYEDLSESERDEILALVRASRGGANTMLWVERYEAVSTAAAAANQDCIFGRLESSTMAWSEIDFSRFTVDQLELRSSAREVGA